MSNDVDWSILNPIDVYPGRARRLVGETAASQLPIDQWHTAIGDPTLADAILDRLIHNAYQINMKGESMRKRQTRLTNHAPPR